MNAGGFPPPEPVWAVILAEIDGTSLEIADNRWILDDPLVILVTFSEVLSELAKKLGMGFSEALKIGQDVGAQYLDGRRAWVIVGEPIGDGLPWTAVLAFQPPKG